jgi:hypothetical protein
MPPSDRPTRCAGGRSSAQKPHHVGRQVGHGVRSGGVVGLPGVAVVQADAAEAIRETADLALPVEMVPGQAVEEDQGLALAAVVVVQREVVQAHLGHAGSLRIAGL